MLNLFTVIIVPSVSIWSPIVVLSFFFVLCSECRKRTLCGIDHGSDEKTPQRSELGEGSGREKRREVLLVVYLKANAHLYL